MSDPTLLAIRDLIQEDIGNRGLRTDPSANLITACPHDFQAACRSVAEHKAPVVAVVTGFYIPHADPPCGETDGPLGALFLARALMPLGIRVILATDDFCRHSLEVGVAACGLRKTVPIVTLPPTGKAATTAADYWTEFLDRSGPLTHVIALERVGPSHTRDSVIAQPGSNPTIVDALLSEAPTEHWDRCHTMKGRDITKHMSPAHFLLEAAPKQNPPVATIGIGDGGNEIGMGKIPWDIIRRNIPGGGLVACRVATDHLIVCGVSNWGAYALGAGVRLLRGVKNDGELFDPKREQELLRVMVENGPLVDGVTGEPTATVDGLSFEQYVEPLRRMGEMCA